MTPQEYRAEVERIIAENAALMGEPVRVAIRRRPGGRIRICDIDAAGRAVLSSYKEYSGWEATLTAGMVANRRARLMAESVAGGMSFSEAQDDAIRKIK